MKDFKSLFYARTGSRSYGTFNESSDYDFRGIYMPATTVLFRGEIQDTIDVSEIYNNLKYDSKYHSIQFLIRKLKLGSFDILKLIYVSDENILQMEDAFSIVLENRRKFLTRRLFDTTHDFLFSQIKRDIYKNERIHKLSVLIDYLKCFDLKTRFSDTITDEIEKDYKINRIRSKNRVYDVYHFDKFQIVGNGPIKSAIEILEVQIEKSSGRTKQKQETSGLDRKELSSALINALFVKNIILDESFKFPFNEDDRKLILDHKYGETSFDEIFNDVSKLYEEINKLDVSHLEKEVPDILLDEIATTICSEFI